MRASVTGSNQRLWLSTLVLSLLLSGWIALGAPVPQRQISLSEQALSGWQLAEPGGGSGTTG